MPEVAVITSSVIHINGTIPIVEVVTGDVPVDAVIVPSVIRIKRN